MAGPYSTTRPRNITHATSARRRTTPKSCVISSTPSRRDARIESMRSRICPRTCASSAVVGSSAISTVGSHANAIAIITR